MAQIIPLELVANLDGQDAALHRGVLAVNHAAIRHDGIDDDFLMRPHDIIGALTPLPDRINGIAAAVIDDQVVGWGETWASTRDNLTRCGVGVTVHPDFRRQGIGTQLLGWAEQQAADLGRTTYESWMMAPILEDGAPAVLAPTGDPFPADFPGWLFAAHHGYSLEQVEKGSTLRLPVANLASLHDDAAAQVAGYRILTWFDELPEEWLDAFAPLRARVTIDAPSAGLQIEEEVWDAARLVRDWELSKAMGNHHLVLVALHEASAQLVAFTELWWHDTNPDCVYQGYTFVRADHRGHRLGMWLKTSAIAPLGVANPAADHIQTDNAGENSYMLAINYALGYRPSYQSAMLQKQASAKPVP